MFRGALAADMWCTAGVMLCTIPSALPAQSIWEARSQVMPPKDDFYESVENVAIVADDGTEGAMKIVVQKVTTHLYLSRCRSC